MGFPYLHAGAGVVVRLADVIGIFDLDGKITTADVADFLRRAEKNGTVEMAGEDLPKCFLLVSPKRRAGSPRRRSRKTTRRRERVVLSHISSVHLSRRTMT